MSKVRFGVDFAVSVNVIFVKNVFFDNKKGARKQTEKKYTPNAKQVTMVVSRGSLTAPPKAKDFSINKNNSTTTQQKLNSNSTKTTILQKWLLHFDLKN